MLARKDAEKERLSPMPCGSDDGEMGDEVKERLGMRVRIVCR